MGSDANLVELDQLVELFYPDVTSLGEFQSVSGTEIPEPQRSLLNHDFHMTIAVEKFHSSPVDVEVLRVTEDSETYSREIRLNRRSDAQPVQYGIVRLNWKHLSDSVQNEIKNQKTPLGKVLIEHNVHRRVRLLSLYKIRPTEKLSSAIGDSTASKLFGRTAIIYCNDEPAIELLEIVASQDF